MWTWDAIFREDERPWIKNHPKGALVVALLRRIASNMVALFRSVTQRSEEKRKTPWKNLLRQIYNAVITGELAEVKTLRPRNTAVG